MGDVRRQAELVGFDLGKRGRERIETGKPLGLIGLASAATHTVDQRVG